LSFLILLAPLFLALMVLLKISSPGPVFYKAQRAGVNAVPFSIIKFRTMAVNSSGKSAITGVNDSRVFPVGNFLRDTKFDELPQLLNVLKGEMSIVGPRPEDMSIVENYYSDDDAKTLSVLPGLASPGSLFNYTHSHDYLDDENTEGSYVEKLLPVKLGIERIYVENISFFYDMKVILRTFYIISLMSTGVKRFELPREYALALEKGYID